MVKNNITIAEYKELTCQSKTKHGNQKTVVDGMTFDSRLEADRYSELKLLEQAGEIQGFGCQPSFRIGKGGTRYRPDFIVCGKDGDIWVEDAKGFETAGFKAKKREWAAVYPWMPLRIVRR